MYVPRKRRGLDPLSPAGIRWTIICRLVKEERLADQKARARELGALKRLQQEFNLDQFWLELALPEQLDTILWFMTDYGRTALREYWRAFQFAHSQAKHQMELDSTSTVPIFDLTPQPLKKRKTALDWADGR